MLEGTYNLDVPLHRLARNKEGELVEIDLVLGVRVVTAREETTIDYLTLHELDGKERKELDLSEFLKSLSKEDTLEVCYRCMAAVEIYESMTQQLEKV